MPGVIAARVRSALRGLSTEGRPGGGLQRYFRARSIGRAKRCCSVPPFLFVVLRSCARIAPERSRTSAPGFVARCSSAELRRLVLQSARSPAGGRRRLWAASSTPQQVPRVLGETFPRLPGTPLFTVEPLDPLEPLLPYLASPFQCKPDPRGPVRTRKGMGQASNPRLFLSSHERASFWLGLEGDRERSAVRRHGPPAHGGQALHQRLVTQLRGRDSNPRSRAHEAREDSLSSTARRTRESGAGLAQWRVQGPPICPSPEREIDAKASPVLHVSRSRRRERCCQSHSPALRPWITYQCPTWRGVGARRSHVSEKLRRPA
jgi:hypothetical protein